MWSNYSYMTALDDLSLVTECQKSICIVVIELTQTASLGTSGVIWRRKAKETLQNMLNLMALIILMRGTNSLPIFYINMNITLLVPFSSNLVIALTKTN